MCNNARCSRVTIAWLGFWIDQRQLSNYFWTGRQIQLYREQQPRESGKLLAQTMRKVRQPAHSMAYWPFIIIKFACMTRSLMLMPIFFIDAMFAFPISHSPTTHAIQSSSNKSIVDGALCVICCYSFCSSLSLSLKYFEMSMLNAILLVFLLFLDIGCCRCCSTFFSLMFTRSTPFGIKFPVDFSTISTALFLWLFPCEFLFEHQLLLDHWIRSGWNIIHSVSNNSLLTTYFPKMNEKKKCFSNSVSGEPWLNWVNGWITVTNIATGWRWQLHNSPPVQNSQVPNCSD